MEEIRDIRQIDGPTGKKFKIVVTDEEGKVLIETPKDVVLIVAGDQGSGHCTQALLSFGFQVQDLHMITEAATDALLQVPQEIEDEALKIRLRLAIATGINDALNDDLKHMKHKREEQPASGESHAPKPRPGAARSNDGFSPSGWGSGSISSGRTR